MFSTPTTPNIHHITTRTETDHTGALIKVSVKRGTSEVSYHRTNRNSKDLFNLPHSEFRPFFRNFNDFTELMLATPSASRILDIGCGGGALVQDLIQAGLPTRGIDIHLEDQPISKLLTLGDAFSLPYPKKHFDCLISSWSVFKYEPVQKMQALLAECFSVLRPGGRLLITPLYDPKKVNALHQFCQQHGAALFVSTENEAIQIIRL